MKVPISWLKQYVPVGVSPKELAHRLTMAGIEVGDHLTAIDGRPVAELDVDAIVDLLEQAAGSKVTFTIRRQAGEFNRELVLRELI